MSRIIRDGLLALGVIMLPLVVIGTVVCAMAAFQSGMEPAATLELLFASFVFGSWGLWAFLSGPVRMRLWAFGAASLLNLLEGVNVILGARPHSEVVGAVFLACSFWQFYIWRRRWTYKSDTA
jgi:hypothetical protein